MISRDTTYRYPPYHPRCTMDSQSDRHPNQPLTEATLFIMISLLPKSKHGYAIMKDVHALSKGRVVLSTGTLYGALKRLLERGWIQRVDGSAPVSTGRLRKAYSLTDLGRQVLSAEVQRLRAVVTIAQVRGAEEHA